MSDRAAKRVRRSGEYEYGGMDGSSTTPTASSTRPRRGTVTQSPAAAVIQRSSPEETRQSIHLTVKSSPNKLRQATGGATTKRGVSRQNIVSGKRASRSSRVVREVDSEEDEDEDEDEDEAEEVDAMDVDDDEDEDDEEDVDADGDEDEDMDAEGEEDEEMDDTPAPRPVIPANRSVPVKPAISITKAQDSVEATEMAMDNSDDDDLSDPESDLDEDAEGEDEDAEGEDDDEVDATMNDGLDDDMDSDEDLSRDQTPDVSKMTKRQRAMVAEEEDGALMALSNEAQKKKHLTAEEHAMRRAEMARRRKNLSEKRQNEEKIDTINRLLKKQPPKRGRKTQDVTESGQEEEAEHEKANPLFVRYVQNAKGTQLGVPAEWLQAPAGQVFTGNMAKPTPRPFGGRMVEEVA
ncbi:hypothetical protein ACN47E_007797 [Coniothyrium glycines]